MKEKIASSQHAFDVSAEIVSIKEPYSSRIYAHNPLEALFQMHKLMQRTMHWRPEDYTIIFLKRDGLAAYNLPKSRNPDVRPRAQHPNEKEPEPTLDLGATESIKPEGNPIFVLPAETPAANTSFPL